MDEQRHGHQRAADKEQSAIWIRFVFVTVTLLLVLVGMFPCIALGESSSTISDEEILEQYRIERSRELDPLPPVDEQYAETSDVVLLTAQQGFPSSYSSEELGYVTSTKNQNPFGNCWAFSAIACVEAYTLRNDVLPGETAETLDLSERHLSYFSYHVPEDPLGYTDGDYVEFVPEGTELAWNSKDCYLNRASRSSVVELALGAYRGVARESVAPYDELLESYNAHAAGDRDFNAFLEETALDDELARENVMTLTNTEAVPMSDVATVKRWILDRGAVMVEFHYDWNYIKFPYATYYCDVYQPNDHYITIVGWDDSVPCEDFGNDISWMQDGQIVSAPNAKPASNGAWLCKNSWGTDWCRRYDEEDVCQGDYEVSRPAGYFWLSYEDWNIQKVQAVSFEVRQAQERAVYMHDGGVEAQGYYAESPFQAASVYQVPQKEDGHYERLSSVGFFTLSPDVRCSVQVVLNPADPTDPSSGEEMLEEVVSLACPYAGFHCIDLSEEVLLESGDTFVVILTFSREDGGVIGSGADVDWGFEGSIYHCACNLGETFAKGAGDGSWTDLASNDSYKVTARIHAYTEDVERQNEPEPGPKPEPEPEPEPEPKPEPTPTPEPEPEPTPTPEPEPQPQPIPEPEPEPEPTPASTSEPTGSTAGQKEMIPLTDDGTSSPFTSAVLAVAGAVCVALACCLRIRTKD